MSDPVTLVHEAAAELTAARHNLSEVISTVRDIERELQKAALALGAAQRRVYQGEARLRSAEAALEAVKT